MSALNNYNGFYNLYPQKFNNNKLEDDFKKHKEQIIDKEMSYNYNDDYYFNKIKSKNNNNNHQNNISELDKEFEKFKNKKFEEDTQEAIRISIKEEEERKLKENKIKEEMEKKKLNDNKLTNKNITINNIPLKNEMNLENNLIDLNNNENLINKEQLNTTKENKTINTNENIKNNKNIENKINQNNNNQSNINSEKSNKQNNNLLNKNINNPKSNNPKSLKETISNIKTFNEKDLQNNSINNEENSFLDNVININIKKKYNQNIQSIIDKNDNEKNKTKIINDFKNNINQTNISSTRSQSISKRPPQPLIYVPLQNPPSHNSCYIHTTIHILYHCKDFSNYIIQLNKNPIINNELIRSLVKIFHDYLLKSQEKTNLPEEYKYIYNPLETFNFRYELDLYSKEKFKLFVMGDPVELIIYLLEKCSEIDSNLIHKLFYIDIREQYICFEDKIKNEIKYDKDNFVREIYTEEILNYLIISEMAFEDFKNQLFKIFKEVSYQHIKKCQKCKLVMQKITVCNILPKYFLINCVWSNKNPDDESIIKFFSMIPFYFNSNDMFDIKEKKCYSLFGIILYCYHLAHYINVIYDNIKDIFILYSDEFIIKFKKLEELYDYLTGKTKKDKIFYPVLLVYQENLTQNKKELKIDYKFYDYLIGKINLENKIKIQQENKINIINEKNDNSIRKLNNNNIQEIKIENNGDEDLINNSIENNKNNDNISIVEHMMNKVNNLLYYNELDKKYEIEVKKKEKEKNKISNEDLERYKNNLKKEKTKRSMSLDKKQYPNYVNYQNYINNNQNENQKKKDLNSIHNNQTIKRKGKNNNIKPSIKKDNNNINKYQTINHEHNLLLSNNNNDSNLRNTMNTFNRGAKAINQYYVGNGQRINYTKYINGCK